MNNNKTSSLDNTGQEAKTINQFVDNLRDLLIKSIPVLYHSKYRISPHQKNDSHNPCGLWESSYYVNLAKSEELLLVQCEVDSNGDSYRSTYHRVVTHAEEAHHLYVSRN